MDRGSGDLLGSLGTMVNWSARFTRLFAMALLSAGLLAAGGKSQDELSPAENRQAETIFRTTMSPFCPGRTLAACPSPNAAKWRSDVRGWLDDGVEQGEIRERLQVRFPKMNLSGAPKTGLGWKMPVLVGLFSFLALAGVLRYFRRGTTGAAPESEPARDEGKEERLDARLDDELEQLE